MLTLKKDRYLLKKRIINKKLYNLKTKVFYINTSNYLGVINGCEVMKIKLFSILAAIILVLCTISGPIFINNANGAINASSNTIKEQSFSTGSRIMDQFLKITELKIFSLVKKSAKL